MKYVIRGDFAQSMYYSIDTSKGGRPLKGWDVRIEKASWFYRKRARAIMHEFNHVSCRLISQNELIVEEIMQS
jgi:hypothetical protein